jgi:hypothetical protein
MYNAHTNRGQVINMQFVVGAWGDLDIVVTSGAPASGDLIPKKNR